MVILLFLAVYLLLLATPVYAKDPAQLSGIVAIIENIIKLLAPAAGIAFFIMLLFGGYQFLTSGGDPKAVGAARGTLTYAVIGIILVVSAWLILQLVGNITGANVTTIELDVPVSTPCAFPCSSPATPVGSSGGGAW